MAWKYGPLFALASLVAAEDYTLHEFPGSNLRKVVYLIWEGDAPLESEDGKVNIDFFLFLMDVTLIFKLFIFSMCMCVFIHIYIYASLFFSTPPQIIYEIFMCSSYG